MTDKKTMANQGDEAADPVWDLLARDAACHPVNPSPWFATRVSARALAEPRHTTSLSRGISGGISREWIRWLIPLPLAASFLAAVGLWQWERQLSEERFERHMEYLASSSFDYEF